MTAKCLRIIGLDLIIYQQSNSAWVYQHTPCLMDGKKHLVLRIHSPHGMRPGTDGIKDRAASVRLDLYIFASLWGPHLRLDIV